jgi:hypothetical protein
MAWTAQDSAFAQQPMLLKFVAFPLISCAIPLMSAEALSGSVEANGPVPQLLFVDPKLPFVL